MKRNDVVNAGAKAIRVVDPEAVSFAVSSAVIDQVVPMITEGIAQMFDAEAAKYGQRANEAGLLTAEGAGYAHDQYRAEITARMIREWKPE